MDVPGDSECCLNLEGFVRSSPALQCRERPSGGCLICEDLIFNGRGSGGETRKTRIASFPV